MTQEFHISITAVGRGEYWVRTEDGAPGVPVAEEKMIWPVETWLQRAHSLMNDPFLGVTPVGAPWDAQAEFNRQQSQNASNLAVLGQELHDHLFRKTIRESWIAAQGIAQNRREILRLRLALKDPELQRLPWEILHGGDRPLATGNDVAFSRYQPGLNLQGFTPDTLASELPLKVLMVIATPNDQENLALRTEVSKLQAELRRSQGPRPGSKQLPTMDVTVLDQPGREQLTQALEQGQYQILHYAGHSNLGQAGGNLYLVNSKTGLTEILSGQDLAGLLVNNGVRMVVLNSCRGAYLSPNTSEEREMSLVQALVSRGIPGVLAMAERIPDDVALTLTTLLYRNLRLGFPIDLSLSRARQGLISTYGSDQFYWALPILYLHERFNGELAGIDLPVDFSTVPLAVAPVAVAAGSSDLDYDPGSRFTELDSEADLDELFDTDDPEAWLDPLEEDTEVYSQDYDRDSADVAEIFEGVTTPSQMSASPMGSSAIAPRNEEEQLLPETSRDAGLDIYANLPENPAYQSSGTQTAGRPTLLQTDQPTQLVTDDGAVESILHPRRRQRWLLGGVASVGLAALLGFGLYQGNWLPGLSPNLPGTESPAARSGPLGNLSTEKLTALAIRKLEEEDWIASQAAIAELLNRGKLEAAKTALAAIPTTQLDQPGFSFLRGRAAWQFAKQGEDDASREDARRYWETAVKTGDPPPSYYNALGFAYYLEGKWPNATEAWLEAIEQGEGKQADASQAPPSTEAASNQLNPTPLIRPDVLPAYAGFALALVKMSADEPMKEQQASLSQAAKLYRMVLSNNPDLFKPQGGGTDWLWTEEVLNDWDALPAAIQD